MKVRERWEYSYHRGRDNLSCPPHSLNLEPTNACNLACPNCSLDRSRKRGFMDPTLFSTLVEQAATIGVREIRLFLAGEPFLHKDIAKMVGLCQQHGLRSILHTNGALMDAHVSRAVMEAGLSVLSVSFDGADKAAYERARKGADFETTVENIRALLLQKQKSAADDLQVILQTIRPVGEPLEPSAAVVDLFRNLPVDHFKVIHPHNWRGEADVGATRRESERPNPCMFLWHELSVGWDGRVLGCCADLNGFWVRGDLTRQPIREVWNNEASRELRRIHARRAPSLHPLCKDCSVPYQTQKVTPQSRLVFEAVKARIKPLARRLGLR